MATFAPALTQLQRMLDAGAARRDGQWEAIDALVNQHGRLRAVQ